MNTGIAAHTPAGRAEKPKSSVRTDNKPFTLAHFRTWAKHLVLDTGGHWQLEDFQAAFVEDVFSGVPEAWLLIPEGNGKTTLIAGLALYHCQHRQSAWVPVAASSRDQAEVLYRQAEGFVIRTPELQARFKCYEGYRRILYTGAGKAMGSRIQVFAADDRTGDGVIPTLCLIDELHRHRDLRLYRTWRGKLGKRDGQIIAISTAGEPGSEFEETRDRIRQSAPLVDVKGSFTRCASKNLILHEWAVPESGDVEDMELVKSANPFSGISLEFLREKREAESMTVTHWRRFTCNLPTRGIYAAIEEKEWNDAVSESGIPEQEPIWVGLDLGWKWDTTAVVPLWFKSHEERLLGKATVLVPPRDGTSLDPHLIEAALRDIHARNPIHTVVMDMTFGEQMAVWIGEEIGADVIQRDQKNASKCENYARFMEALRNGWLKHSGDEKLSRHALNAIAKVLPGGETKFDRSSQSRYGTDQMRDQRVIDALDAAAMVHAVAASQQPPSVYEQRGALILDAA